jgi:4-hydroxy-tetrahydrodipicolinate synthase
MEHGIHVALITPIKDDKIDFESLTNLIKSIENDAYCSGIVLFGSTGEGNLLSIDDKILILSHVEKIVTRLQVSIGLNGIIMSEVIKFGKIASKFFPDKNFMLSPPSYIKASQKTIINYYSAIIDEFLDCQFIIYNIPSRTGVKIEIDTIVTLKEKYNKQIIALKDATGSVIDMMKLNSLNKDIDIYCGDDLLYPAMKSLGAVGLISVFGNYSCSVLENESFDNELIKQLEWTGSENPRMIKFLLYKKNIIKSHETIKPLCDDIDEKTNVYYQLFNKENNGLDEQMDDDF